MSRKIEIVIVGGGSGASLASKLSAARAKFDPAKYNITLITPLPYHVFLIATARIAATPEGALDSTDQAFIPLDKVFNSEKGNAGRVVRGRVTNVLEDRVELDDGTSLRYDYLILATGSVWSGPTNYGQHSSEGQVRSHINTWRKNISSARRIVIVGGGAVGIEIAGEIKHYHPRTAVTIVHGGDKLLNGAYPDKLRDRVKKRLETAGVNVILSDRVLDVPDEGLSGEDGKPAVLRTTHGVTLDADLFIPALGPRPNTSLIASLRGGAALSSSGHVRVAPTLNVQFGPSGPIANNIWAIGDIIDWNEQHTLYKTYGHIDVVYKNLLAATSGSKQAEYKGGMEAIFLTVGPNGGVGYMPFLWGLIFGDWLVSMMKSSGLGIKMGRGAVGYK